MTPLVGVRVAKICGALGSIFKHYQRENLALASVAKTQECVHDHLTFPPPVVAATESATNSGTKTAPIFEVSEAGSFEPQRLTEIREPPVVPENARRSPLFKVQ